MFDVLGAGDRGAGASGAGVEASDITAWQRALADSLLTSPHGAGVTDQPPGDATELVDRIRALEELVCTATAAQAALTDRLAAVRRSADATAGVPAARRGRDVVGLVAFARRESPHRASRHVGLARIVASELPHTWHAWRTGRITEWTATLLARETACLALEHRLAVDATVAADADHLARQGTAEVVAAARTEAERLDVAACVKRRRRAESERHVTLRPAPDTMTWFGALLPVKQGVALYAALARAADSARATGDERSRGQVMADALVARGTAAAEGRGDAPAEVGVQLGLVMSDQTLFETTDEPAHLDGYGPIPAELAREIVAGALRAEQRVWLRRLYTAPTSGELVAADAHGRLFPAALARLIRLRDRICRTTWCGAPIRHIDHAEDHARGGRTSRINGQGLCEACNHAKQGTGWQARPGPDGAVETRLPTGHTMTTRPPPLIRIRERPGLTIDYCLTG